MDRQLEASDLRPTPKPCPSNLLQLNKYEIAALKGNRAVQLSMGAPALVDYSHLFHTPRGADPLDIAELEFQQGVIPLVVRRESITGHVQHLHQGNTAW